MLIRHLQSPVLTASQVPYSSDCVFNAGVVRWQGEYLMMFRNDFGYEGGSNFSGTNLGLARSEDGLSWQVDVKPVLTAERIREMWAHSHNPRFGAEEIRRVYDPRLTAVEGRLLIALAMDTPHGVLGVIAETEDFSDYQLHAVTTPDNRNMVLFPERIDGRFWRLERPFPIYGRGHPEAFDIWISSSPDLRFWGDSRLLLGSEEVPFANSKIGPAAPPLKTASGWLTTIHSVFKDPDNPLKAWGEIWIKRYDAGLILLDLDNPSRVIGMMRKPLLTPETDYELEGFRGSVIFPCGLLLHGEEEVRLYYGAADTVIGLATGNLSELIEACEPLPQS
jgi:beta-1,4-mannooligosaccharide/beta-1,4-mannosyl-N-acetylglucosamine phosphorylase